MRLIPHSNSEDNAPLMEFNACHSPEDGKFCSTEGQGLSRVREDLMRLSFGGFRDIETMAALDDNGKRVGDILYGTVDGVQVPPEIGTKWRRFQGSLTVVHTHPSSSAFSFDDLNFANRFNTFEDYEGPIKIRQMVVYGKDGTRYDMELLAPIPDDVLNSMRFDYQTRMQQAIEETRADVNKELLSNPRMNLKAGQRVETWEIADKAREIGIDLNERMSVYYKDRSYANWKAIEAKFPGWLKVSRKKAGQPREVAYGHRRPRDYAAVSGRPYTETLEAVDAW